MPTRLTKSQKFRGSRTSWMGTDPRPGAWNPRRIGKTGGHKHGWTYIVVYDPDHFGKHGFYLKAVSQVFNVGELNQLTDTLLTRDRHLRRMKEYYIDWKSMGVDKLLGSGKVDKPLILKVKAFSAGAAEKIREAKGQIIE